MQYPPTDRSCRIPQERNYSHAVEIYIYRENYTYRGNYTIEDSYSITFYMTKLNQSHNDSKTVETPTFYPQQSNL
jgi:hypothetical protein